MGFFTKEKALDTVSVWRKIYWLLKVWCDFKLTGGEKKHRPHEISRDVLGPHTWFKLSQNKEGSGMSGKYVEDLENRVSLAH